MPTDHDRVCERIGQERDACDGNGLKNRARCRIELLKDAIDHIIDDHRPFVVRDNVLGVKRSHIDHEGIAA
jgi:hypothetical protein